MKPTIGSPIWRAALALATMLAVSVPALAQTQVRVVRDQTTIWRRDTRIPATQVRAGTILDVVGRDGDWYIVVVPEKSGGTGETGLIAAALVTPVAGSSESPPASRPQPRSGAPAPAADSRSTHKPIEVFASGHVGVTGWLAHQTFSAVLGHSIGPVFGGGLDVRVHGNAFVQGAVDWFEQTGQRVVVSNGQVFPLGIRDTVRVVPVSVTVGLRHDLRKGTAYVGGGLGRYFYKETSDFADPTDNVDQRFLSYHALAGVELGVRGPLRTAVEVQFTTVPNGLGTSGASASFGEQNLGGVQVRLKVLVGR